MKKVTRRGKLLSQNILEPTTSVGAAKMFMERRLEEGTACPVCEQYAKAYRRKLNSGMALALVTMYRSSGTSWCRRTAVLRDLPTSAHDNTLLHHWGLFERGEESGWWRVTRHGRDFVLNEIEVPKFAVVYNNKLVRLEGPWIDIHHALGDRFSLDELMGA